MAESRLLWEAGRPLPPLPWSSSYWIIASTRPSMLVQAHTAYPCAPHRPAVPRWELTSGRTWARKQSTRVDRARRRRCLLAVSFFIGSCARGGTVRLDEGMNADSRVESRDRERRWVPFLGCGFCGGG